MNHKVGDYIEWNGVVIGVILNFRAIPNFHEFKWISIFVLKDSEGIWNFTERIELLEAETLIKIKPSAEHLALHVRARLEGLILHSPLHSV